MAIDYESLGKRIANARKQTGITQEALGEQLNMTRKHISVIETAINRPSLDTLVDIANALYALLFSSSSFISSTADFLNSCIISLPALDTDKHLR